MTDLRPLMGLHFECVSASCSPGLDSKGLHQRKLQGLWSHSKGALLTTMLLTYKPADKVLMSLTNLGACSFDQKPEMQSAGDTSPSLPIGILRTPPTTTHPSDAHRVLLGQVFHAAFSGYSSALADF